MINMSENILPYKGLESFKFGDKIESVRLMLKKEKISVVQCMGEKQYIHPELKNETIVIKDSIKLYFVDGILFEIGLENGFKGHLPNGICIGMDIDKAVTVDPDLEYDDDEEAFVSSKGYTIIDDVTSNLVSYIEIYVPEVENSEEFFQYDWLERFK